MGVISENLILEAMIMKVSLGDLVRSERQRLDLSQIELGRKIGVTQSAISGYESGNQDIPDDVIISMVSAMNSMRLRMAYSFARQGQLVNIPLLNNVDTNMVTILTSICEEGHEMNCSADDLVKLTRNKKSRSDFTEFEWSEFERHCEQIGDIYAAVNLFFTEAVEKFDLDIDKITKALVLKYIDRHYISEVY